MESEKKKRFFQKAWFWILLFIVTVWLVVREISQPTM